MRLIYRITLACFVAAGVVIPKTAEAATPPNVVIIMADDMRADAIGDMTQLQSLIVDHGVTFQNAMVPTSLCCPSRATTLTGKFAHTTGVWGNAPGTGGWSAFKKNGWEKSNLFTWLHDAGYTTALIGKYLNGYDNAPNNYEPPKVDRWVAMREAAYYEYDLVVDGGTSHFGTSPDYYSTDLLATQAAAFIKNAPTDQPLFAYVAPYGTHPPFTPAPRDIGDCADERAWSHVAPPSYNTLPQHAPKWMARLHAWGLAKQEKVDNWHRKACEARLSVDDLVGTVVDALQTTGRLDNTLLIFMADNGFIWGEHRLYGKSMPHEAATRVPMVMRMDGVIPAESVDGRMALNVDIAATISDVTGIAFPGLEGRSVLGNPREGFVLEAIAKPDGNKRPAFCGYRTNWAMYAKYANGDAELYDYSTNAYSEKRNQVNNPRYAKLLSQLRSKAKANCRPLPPGFHW